MVLKYIDRALAERLILNSSITVTKKAYNNGILILTLYDDFLVPKDTIYGIMEL